MEIKADKKASDELKAKEEAREKIVIGESLTEELKKAVTLDSNEAKEEKRTRVLKVTYKPEQAKLMAAFFRENKIQFEFIKTDF